MSADPVTQPLDAAHAAPDVSHNGPISHTSAPDVLTVAGTEYRRDAIPGVWTRRGTADCSYAPVPVLRSVAHVLDALAAERAAHAVTKGRLTPFRHPHPSPETSDARMDLHAAVRQQQHAAVTPEVTTAASGPRPPVPRPALPARAGVGPDGAALVDGITDDRPRPPWGRR